MDTETLKNNTDSEPIAVWAITPNGLALGQKIQSKIKNSILYVSVKMGDIAGYNKKVITFEKLSRELHARFNHFSGHIFIFSTGIAVRLIAPLLKSKTIDPAVVVVDDNGNHAISLLSGHLGGANVLAQKIAALLHATPVITTATDINQLPSIDLLAQANRIYIETPENIKHINMAFLMGELVAIHDPLNRIMDAVPETLLLPWTNKDAASGKVFCSHELQVVPRETLILRPLVLSVGIGCNRGTSRQEIEDFLTRVFQKEGLSTNSIATLATSTVKEDEKGLIELGEKLNLPLDFYSKDALNSVTTIQTPSKMVEKHLGVKSVCEAAAILSAQNGKLIVSKKKNKDVTIAVAIKK